MEACMNPHRRQGLPHAHQCRGVGDRGPGHKTGSHRRVFIGDLMRYRDVRDAERRKALAELTSKSAELGLDY